VVQPQRFQPPTVTVGATTYGTYGNARRDSLVGPGLTELDFSAVKDTHITERLNLQFRAEFFNIPNHTNFLTPNEVVYSSATQLSPTAGVVTATSTTSRQIQFGAKLQFLKSPFTPRNLGCPILATFFAARMGKHNNPHADLPTRQLANSLPRSPTPSLPDSPAPNEIIETNRGCPTLVASLFCI